MSDVTRQDIAKRLFELADAALTERARAILMVAAHQLEADHRERFRPQDGQSVAGSTEQPTPYTREQLDALEKALHPTADAFVDAPADLMRNWRRRLLATARQGVADSELLRLALFHVEHAKWDGRAWECPHCRARANGPGNLQHADDCWFGKAYARVEQISSQLRRQRSGDFNA